VFVAVVDPVGSGLVASLARPGGNTTGFTLFEYSIGTKWLELLKEIAPHIARVAVLRDSTIAAGIGVFAPIQASAASTGMELSTIDLSDPSEIEHAVATFARGARGGLIVTPSPFGANHPEVIAAICNQAQVASSLSVPLFHPRQRLALIRDVVQRPIQARRRISRSHPQGREAC